MAKLLRPPSPGPPGERTRCRKRQGRSGSWVGSTRQSRLLARAPPPPFRPGAVCFTAAEVETFRVKLRASSAPATVGGGRGGWGGGGADGIRDSWPIRQPGRHARLVPGRREAWASTQAVRAGGGGGGVALGCVTCRPGGGTHFVSREALPSLGHRRLHGAGSAGAGRRPALFTFTTRAGRGVTLYFWNRAWVHRGGHNVSLLSARR